MIDRRADAPPSAAVRWLAAGVSGLMLAAAFPPFDYGFVAWAALLPLLWGLSYAEPRAAAGRGWLAGFVFMAGVGYFTTSFGGEALWMRLLPWGLFAAIEALWFIPVGVALAAVLRRGNPWLTLLGAPSVWVVGEWARGAGALGFPFGMLGYALHNQPPIIQAAALGGVHMVSAFAVLAAVAAYLLLFGGRKGRWAAFAAAALPILGFFTGMAALTGDEERSHLAEGRADVAVAQGSIHARWGDPDGQTAFDALARETLNAAARAQTDLSLIVWPESAVPGLLLEEPDLLERAARVARAADAPLLVGTIGLASDGRPSNLAVLLGPDGRARAAYQKRRLVPFGEWVPLRRYLPLLDAFGVSEEDQAPGDEWTILPVGDLRIGAPICFESAHPGIARAFVRRGANLLVVITNDAWFFHTGMAEQHAAVAPLRAVETGRWVVRCGLTGISGFITPRGEWTARLPLDTAGAMVGTVELENSLTPFVRYGDWFPAACSILAAFALLFPRFRRVSSR